MLRTTTTHALENIMHSLTKHIHFLQEHCPGVIINEIKKEYSNGEDLENKKILSANIYKLKDEVIAHLNEAVRTNNTERLRKALNNFFETFENIFQSSLNIHLAYEIPYDRQNLEAKGKHIAAHQDIVKDCKKAVEFLEEDQNLKGEIADFSKLAEGITVTIKNVSQLLGLKVKEEKNHKIIQLIDPNLAGVGPRIRY